MIATVLPGDLPAVLDHAPAGCRVLSLDCFDTLLWRHAHAPDDVFADIGEAGGQVQQRRWAESHARAAAALRHGRNEARLDEIYAMLLPNASAERRGAGVAAELDAEARHCFAFAPTVELMREAKRRGLEVIIVSDTYLSHHQLGTLIAAAAGDAVRDLIDRIFCSSDYGMGKAEGLFGHVLADLGVPADRVLHVGDNAVADGEGALAAGIASRHLVQFGGDSQQRLRLEAALSAVLHAGGGGRGGAVPAWQPHRAQLALGEPAVADPATRLGYSVLGPLFQCFNRWLCDEAQALRDASGARVHLVFLMRDGYLPMRVFEAAGELDGATASAVEISRFAATAAGFTDGDAIDRYLEREVELGDVEGMARQLLFTDAERAALMRDARVLNRTAAFADKVRQPQTVARIVRRSAGYGERLVAHVRRAVDPQPGDTLMLVDLGYNGSVQSRIEPLLASAFGVTVAGRYLILCQQEIEHTDKRGLFDHRHYDMAALVAMCGNVAVLEQLCTVAQGSVVDYRPDGTPIRKRAGLKSTQSDARDRVQQGCLRFVADTDADGAMLHPPRSDTANSRRQAAAAVMARFMFLPLPAELEVLGRFEHDVNLGCEGTVALFDPAGAADALRHQGLFYLRDAQCMFLPAELRGQGLSLSLSLLAQRRFGLDLRMSDFREPGIALPILVADGRDVTLAQVEASRTHDGFFSAVIPIGTSQYAIGLQFGRLFEWVEIEAASFRPVDALDNKRRGDRRRTPARPSFEGMEAVSPKLMRCVDETAFMMVPPPGGDQPLVLSVVFRPIVARPATAPAAPSQTRSLIAETRP